MDHYRIDYGRPVLAQLIECLSNKASKRMFKQSFVATDLLSTEQTMYMPLDDEINRARVAAVFSPEGVLGAELHGDQVVSVHKLVVTEDHLISQTNVAFGATADEQIQFIFKETQQSFLMSCKQLRQLPFREIKKEIPKLQQKLRVLKLVNDQLENYFTRVLPEKLQEEEERKMYNEIVREKTSQERYLEVINLLGKKYDEKKPVAQPSGSEPPSSYVSEEFMKSLGLTTNIEQVEELSVIQRELYSIKYYKCFQNVYYYLDAHAHLLGYLLVLRSLEQHRTKLDMSQSSSMEDGIIEHISYDVLLQLFGPLHKAFKSLIHINNNFTNQTFRNTIFDIKLHVVQLMKVLLQINTVQILEEHINHLYNTEIKEFLQCIDPELKTKIEGQLLSFPEKFKYIMFLMNLPVEDYQIVMSENMLSLIDERLENILSTSMIAKLTVEQNSHLHCYLAHLREIQNYFIDIYNLHEKFSADLEQLKNFNQNNMSDLEVELVVNKNMDVLQNDSKELFSSFSTRTKEHMVNYLKDKYKQLYRLQAEYVCVNKHFVCAMGEVSALYKKINDDKVNLALDRSDLKMIMSKGDAKSVAMVSQMGLSSENQL